MRKPKITVEHVKLLISLAILFLGAYFIFSQGRDSLEYPLLGHHCMKTSKAVEVSYNLVRYKDPLSQYVDWHATPANPRGRLGSIFKYESPLSAFLIAGLYLIVDGSDFMTRVDTARYFTLVSLIAAYLLVGFFILRRDIFALFCFSFLLATSFFAISYSTKPQAETFSILYQAMAVVVMTALVRMNIRPFFKYIIVVGLVGLLCAGGKMNYFIIAAPLIAVYPFLDPRIKGAAAKAKYYSLFIAAVLVGALGLKLFTSFSFSGTFVFFIKGNKPMIDDSLWKTFMEGFDGFTEVWERTREHFGKVLFGAGVYSTLYLAAKFVYLMVRKGKKPTTAFETFQMVLFLFIVGHSLNYVVLRNLYIPHRYYVVPLFIIFCMGFTAFLADVRDIALGRSRLFEYARRQLERVRNRGPLARLDFSRDTVAHFQAFSRITSLLIALSWAAGYLAGELSVEGEFRGPYIHTLKFMGSSALSYELNKHVVVLMETLSNISRALLWASLSFFAINLAVFFVFSKSAGVRGAFAFANRLLEKMRITASSSVLWVVMLVVGALIIAQNGGMYFEEDNWQQDKIELAEKLEKIRNDTKSGDLVLCWKWCYAFYADKRSITDAKETDIDYYVQNRLDSVMGPKRPLNAYYNRLRKYSAPATYWKLKSDEEIARIKEARIKRGVFGKPVH